MDSETLRFLLKGGHLNIPDRIEKGLWPHDPIKLSTLVSELATLLESERWFPRVWNPHVPGEAVHEGGVIERSSPTEYIYRSQRHHPLAPDILAEACERKFGSSTEAATYYLKWDLHLPGDLDGWIITE